MTATLTGAIKAYLAPLEPTVAVYRDRAPEVAAGATLGPYLIVTEAVTRAKRLGDEADPAGTIAVDEEVQVDLYQLHHNDGTFAITEDVALPDRLLKALDRAALTAAPGHVHRFRVLTCSRFPDLDANLIRHTYRCLAHRDL